MGDTSLLPVFLLPLLFLLFPDGRPPSPRWRWSMWALLTGFATFIFGYALSPGPLNNFVDTGILYVNPIGVRALATISPVLAGVGGITIALAALSTVPAVRWRYKRSAPEERQQLRWLVTVATLAGALLLVLLLTIVVSPDNSSAALNTIFTALFLSILFTVAIGVPAAYLVAIFRYRLWDLDVVIKKAAVALVLAVLISGIAITFALNVGQFALWRETPKPVTILVGIAVGLLFVPLLRLSRKLADRVVFGRRATPYEVLTSFSGRVGETYSTEDVLPRMAEVMRSATGADAAAVWLRIGGELREDATSPPSDERRTVSAPRDHLPNLDGEHTVEVRHQGELLGALSVRMAASDPMNPAKDRLMRDLASQAGLVLRNVRLLEDLRTSRRRIVAAQDERARKLERDLHDGAQQQLVAQSVQLKLARTMLDRDVERAGQLLDGLQTTAGEALEDLRDLARGIYPPLLADKGLVAALESQARKAAVSVGVVAEGIDRYPQETEAAVYFCVLEALNNVAKYAEASRASVSLRRSDGHLIFTVDDDGTGFDIATIGYGTGLQGMADRLAALNGSLEVHSAPGEGTRVVGSIPLDRGAPMTEFTTVALGALS